MTAYIDLVPPETAEGERKELYDDLERVRGKGRVSNLFRGYGAFPALGRANFNRLNILLQEGHLSQKLKEAIMTALAEINHCTYCVSFHATAMLRRRQEHGRRAKPALESIQAMERALQFGNSPALVGTFYCLDFGTVRLDRQHETAARQSAVDEYRACAASTMLATDMGTG